MKAHHAKVNRDNALAQVGYRPPLFSVIELKQLKAALEHRRHGSPFARHDPIDEDLNRGHLIGHPHHRYRPPQHSLRRTPIGILV